MSSFGASVIVLITYSVIGVNSNCYLSTYHPCIEDLEPLTSSPSKYFPAVTVENMRTLCSVFEKARTCISNFEHKCTDETRATFQSLHAYYDHICHDNAQAFATHRNCLLKPELEVRIDGCDTSFFQAVFADRIGKPCGYIRAYIDCVEAEVRAECGEEAAQWQVGLEEATRAPTLNISGCRLDMRSRAYCTQVNVEKCLEYLDSHPIEDGRHIVPTHDTEVLKEMCMAYERVRPCIDTLKDECHKFIQRQLQSLHDSYEYICESHMQGYLQHRDCFAKPDLLAAGIKCESSYQSLSDSKEGDLESERRRICKNDHEFVDCVYNVVESVCDSKAALWQWGLRVAVHNPFLEYYGCPLKTVGERTSVLTLKSSQSLNLTMVAVFIAVLIVISVIVVSAVICFLKKKTRRANRPQRLDEEPPAGTAPGAPPPGVPPPAGPQPQLVVGVEGATYLAPPEYTEKPGLGEVLAQFNAMPDETKVPLPEYDNDLSEPIPEDDPRNHVYMEVANLRTRISK